MPLIYLSNTCRVCALNLVQPTATLNKSNVIDSIFCSNIAIFALCAVVMIGCLSWCTLYVLKKIEGVHS